MRHSALFVIVSMLAAAAVTAAPGTAEEPTRLLRFADIHGDRVTFVYAGDIWIAPSDGGDARRLTTDQGLELFPKFSPDGTRIAFSAEYGGTRQVYVIDAAGGTPRQLTFYNDVGPMPPRGGFDYEVLDWTPDGRHVLFRANRLPWGVRMGRPYLVPADGGPETPLAVPEGGGGMLSPDGKRFVYTPIAREFRTWKRHRGGRAQDVWIYDLERNSSRQITDFEGTDNQPVWVGETIYFTSDRGDGRLNLWSWQADGTTRRVTEHADYDVLWPSAGPRQVVYECGGYLYRYDPAAGHSTRIPVRVTGDFLQTVPRIEDVSDEIAAAEISPSGARALIEARGDIFTVPAEKGSVRNLTATPGIREMNPTWSPDGRWVAYLSDRSGEYEIHLRAHDGSGEERRVTRDGDTWRFAPVWSPDSKKLAYSDKRQRLRFVDVDSGKTVDVDRGVYNDITTYRWSPDGKWLAYTKLGESRLASIWVYSTEQEKAWPLTADATNDYAPVFDPQGRYLYFLSDRDYNLTFSAYEFNYLYTGATRVYAGLLQSDGPALLLPRSDEEEPGKGEDQAPKEKEKKKEAKEDKPFRIDIQGFDSRVVALPEPAGNFGNLRASDKAVFYMGGNGESAEIRMFDLESEEAKQVMAGALGFELSHDGKKLLYAAAGGRYGIVDASPDRKAGDGVLKLDEMTVKVDPRAEWRQIYRDGWRIVRDWFYDPDLHGVDWDEMYALYLPLAEAVAHRGDLDYVFGELGGELSAGHFYVNWGDMPEVERIDGGLLGAELERHESGYYRIAHILPGENWHDDFRSPLTVPGVNVEEGEFILAVDGASSAEVDNFYRLLEGKGGRTVALLVNGTPTSDGARTVRVTTITRETNLRYLDWVASRREMVERLSDGKIGYIHLPNTAFEGNRELRKHFYAQSHKQALIFDARYNGGGFIPDRMMELVSRTQLSYWARRGVEPMRTPGFAHEGPKVCLINGYSSSGGDAFPYYFRKLGLGELIGTRTWGGLIGISFNPSFMDGGSISVPSFRFYDTEGNWAVENVGVAPDIEVVDRPEQVARGEDPTLAKAVEVLLEQLRQQAPGGEPPRPKGVKLPR